jgi:hypothetical protein
MALIHTVPTTKVVLPSVAGTFPNGVAPASLLRDVGDGFGPMLILPSLGRQAMGIAAAADGIFLKSVGRGRSLLAQYNLLHARYRMSPPTNRDTNWVQAHTWGGKAWPAGTWYNFTGAMAATPGKSNHGWWSADDIAEELDGDAGAEGLSDRGLIWLRENGPSFGYGLETHVERWHWHWIAGDNLPRRVIDVLTFVGIPIDGSQPIVVPPQPPLPEPQPPVVVPPAPPTPPVFDPANRQYGLFPFDTGKRELTVGATGDDVRYAQGVIKNEVARFADWFVNAPGYISKTLPNGNPNPGYLFMVACRDSAKAMTVDGQYGQRTADAVGYMQSAFRWTAFDGQAWGELTPDKKIGPKETWPFIDAQSNGVYAG